MIDTDEKIDTATAAVMSAIRTSAENSESVLHSLKTNPAYIEAKWRMFFEDLFEESNK